MKKHVLCLGNIAYDLIVNNKDNKKDFTLDAHPGGSVFNTALLLSKLNCPVSTIAKTGNDFLGNQLISTMKQFKINTKCVFQSKRVKTAIALANINKIPIKPLKMN